MNASATDAAPSLSEVLATHRVVVTVGSGGVGKTTTAAALGVRAAMEGKRVLVLTIDPARRLANSLGLDRIAADEQQIGPEVFEAHGLPLRGSLSAMMLDTKRTFDELVRKTAGSPDAAERILRNDIYGYVAGSLAGTSEYMAMEKLHAVKDDARFDLVVLDTPPTSNALDFLDAPEKMIAAIDSPAMRWFIEAFREGEGRGFFAELVAKSTNLVLKGLSRFTGAGFLEQVAEFVTGMNELFGGFQTRAQEVARDLRGDDVAFVIVTSPAPMAIREAIFFGDRLGDYGMRRDGVVVNGVHTLFPEPSAPPEQQRAALEAALAGDEVDVRELHERMGRALEDERMRAVADRIETDRLRNRLDAAVPFVEVPAFEEDVHDVAALARVATYLVGEASVDGDLAALTAATDTAATDTAATDTAATGTAATSQAAVSTAEKEGA
ncbi:MAG: ArsA-related P-loop ATPase [Myxococcota bacterium]